MPHKANLNPTKDQQAHRDIERCKRILIKLEDPKISAEKKASFEAEYNRRKASLDKFKESIESLK